MNNINEKGNHDCISCQMCAAVCPTSAIAIKLSKDGFYVPYVDTTKCVSCGLCKQVCYKFESSIPKPEFVKAYSGINKNNKIVRDSSSGGLASEIYTYAINNNYKCLGVIYDNDKHIAKGELFSEIEDISKYHGSKYIPVYFQDVLQLIVKTNDKLCIIATPCVVYAINKFIITNKKKRNNYILVDFFCHGTPSQLLWNKQIEELSRKNKGVHDVQFRSKKYGWHNFVLNYKTATLQSKYTNNAFFYKMFFSDLLLNKCCYNCKIRNFTNIPDLRIGDFWGEKYDTNNTGVSSLITFSKKGEELKEYLSKSCIIKNEKLEGIIPYQAINRDYKINSEHRENLLECLQIKKPKDVYFLYLSLLSLKLRSLLYIKNIIIFLFPQSLLLKIRKIYHKIVFR